MKKGNLEKFKEYVEAFRVVQSKYSDKGAADTEPRVVFLDLVEDVINGTEIDKVLGDMPDADRWQLYTATFRCGAAAKALNAAAKRALRVLATMGPPELQQVRDRYLR